MEGEVAPLTDRAEVEAAWEIYRARFPFVKDFEAEIARSTFYQFKPQWVRLIDNARGFGYKQEISIKGVGWLSAHTNRLFGW